MSNNGIWSSLCDILTNCCSISISNVIILCLWSINNDWQEIWKLLSEKATIIFHIPLLSVHFLLHNLESSSCNICRADNRRTEAGGWTRIICQIPNHLHLNNIQPEISPPIFWGRQSHCPPRSWPFRIYFVPVLVLAKTFLSLSKPEIFEETDRLSSRLTGNLELALLVNKRYK